MSEKFCEFVFGSDGRPMFSDIIKCFENLGYSCTDPGLSKIILRENDGEHEFSSAADALRFMENSSSGSVTLWDKNKNELYIRMLSEYRKFYLKIYPAHEKNIGPINSFYSEMKASKLDDYCKYIVIDRAALSDIREAHAYNDTGFFSPQSFLSDGYFGYTPIANYKISDTETNIIKNDDDEDHLYIYEHDLYEGGYWVWRLDAGRILKIIRSRYILANDEI